MARCAEAGKESGARDSRQLLWQVAYSVPQPPLASDFIRHAVQVDDRGQSPLHADLQFPDPPQLYSAPYALDAAPTHGVCAQLEDVRSDV